jgi:hypothetical protein
VLLRDLKEYIIQTNEKDLLVLKRMLFGMNILNTVSDRLDSNINVSFEKFVKLKILFIDKNPSDIQTAQFIVDV